MDDPFTLRLFGFKKGHFSNYSLNGKAPQNVDLRLYVSKSWCVQPFVGELCSLDHEIQVDLECLVINNKIHIFFCLFFVTVLKNY